MLYWYECPRPHVFQIEIPDDEEPPEFVFCTEDDGIWTNVCGFDAYRKIEEEEDDRSNQ